MAIVFSGLFLGLIVILFGPLLLAGMVGIALVTETLSRVTQR